MRKTILLLALPLILSACEMKVGKDHDGNEASVSVGADGNVSIAAPGDSKGLSVSVPGFAAKVNIPGLNIGSADMDIDGVKLYPGTSLQGINVDGHEGAGSGVNMRFASDATPAVLAKYYADSAREHAFTDVSVDNDNGKAIVTATKPDGDRMTIDMTPGAKGGTTGQIVVIDSK